MNGVQERSDLEAHGFAHPASDTWLLHFVWPTNPLPMNGSRGHRMQQVRATRAVRNAAFKRVDLAGIPPLGRCRAQLTWWVTDRRVRDADNLARLEKPLFDALVDGGVVTDDRPELMDKPRAVIRHISDPANFAYPALFEDGMVTGSGFVLTVTRLDGGMD